MNLKSQEKQTFISAFKVLCATTAFFNDASTFGGLTFLFFL